MTLKVSTATETLQAVARLLWRQLDFFVLNIFITIVFVYYSKENCGRIVHCLWLQEESWPDFPWIRHRHHSEQPLHD